VKKEIGTLYRANGSTLTVYPTDGKKFQLAELQQYVGGTIALVPGTGRAKHPATYCNDNGRLEHLPLNRLATKTFARALGGEYLVGDILEVRRVDR
jgi:Domain of unknown function (DUF3846)